MAPSGEWLNHDEEVGGAMPLILVVPPLDLTGSQRQTRADVGMQLHWFLVEADGGVACVVGLLIEREDILHGRHELAAHRWDTPLSVSPGLELVF
jgi:hypothetical protein